MTKETRRQRNYGGSTVTVKGKLVMEEGKLLNTPFARGWWKKKLRNKPVKKITF